jgi:hypothetical protein
MYDSDIRTYFYSLVLLIYVVGMCLKPYNVHKMLWCSIIQEEFVGNFWKIIASLR